MNRNQFRFLLASTITVTILSTARAQLFQWAPESGGNGHYYQPVVAPAGISWTAASSAAQAMGGYLVTVTSAAENAFVFSLIDAPGYWFSGSTVHNYGPWIGAYQPDPSSEPAGGWQWVNGDGDLNSTFSSWWSGEPNDMHYETAPNGEDFAHFGRPNSPTLRDATWNDLPDLPTFFVEDGVLVRSYVVEFNAVPEPSTIGVVVGMGLGTWAARRQWKRRA